MTPTLQQIALTDALLDSWGAIRLRLGKITRAFDAELAQVALRLAAADSAEKLARSLDDLIDLIRDTAAEPYVRSLIARAAVPPAPSSPVPSLSVTGSILPGNQRVLREPPSPKEAAPAPPAPARAGGVMPDIQWRLARFLTADMKSTPVPIFFATNRTRSGIPEEYFAGEPASALTFGQAVVNIPERHQTGHLESPAWWNVFADKHDDRRYAVLRNVQTVDEPAWKTQLESVGAADLLVFLHGYKNTFEDAARRAAQVAHDMRFAGPVVLFSWPSLGQFLGYNGDETRAEASGEDFAAFLKSLEGGPWKRVHVMAHSMGNRVMMSGFADNPRAHVPLSQIVFLAADVYRETFEKKFPKMAGCGDLVTSYASKADRALLLSSRLHAGNRIGFVSGGQPYVTAGLETIDASLVDTGILGHSYFGDVRSVLTDIGYLLRECLPASRRGLQPGSGNKYWLFPK